MLRPYQPPVVSPQDEDVFETLVRRDHWARRAEKHVDFLKLREVVEEFYTADFGCPGVEPVLLIKLELILYHDNLSDSQLWGRVETDVAYRWFLGLGRNDHLPDKSTLGRFRARLGSEGFQKLFHGLVGQAREHGLIRDRLRIKDATHIIADIAVPAGLSLVAQARNRLLNAAEPFDPERVAGERVRLDTIRDSTDGQANDVRLLGRIEHLRDILAWTDEIDPPQDAETNPTWRSLADAREIARKTLAGHDAPSDGDKLRSVSDPDARRGRHGEFYDGYMLDVMIDADSEFFTAVNVLPASGNESADALTLVEQETSAHGNRIEQLSIDGAGFNGPVLRELEDKHDIDVYVPDKATSPANRFGPEDFELSDDGSHATCPAGERSKYRQRDEAQHATSYRFDKATCEQCPLFGQCIGKPQKHGRTVKINDYAPEYARVRERAQTEAYAEVKREHPAVERKLGHLMNRYRNRRARYRGLAKVLSQQLMGALTANVDRLVRLLDAREDVQLG
jgi:transposase